MDESGSEEGSLLPRMSLEPTRCLCLGETIMLRIDRSEFEEEGGWETPPEVAPPDGPDLGNMSLK